MNREKYIPEGTTDSERLMYAMNQVKDHNFKEIDENSFENPAMAISFNEMLNELMDANNRHVMRINDGLIKISDNSTLVRLIDRIKDQKSPIDHMRELSSFFDNFAKQNESEKIAVIALVKQINSAIEPLKQMYIDGRRLYQEGNQEKSAETFDRIYDFLCGMSEQTRLIESIGIESNKHKNVLSDMLSEFSKDIKFLVDNYDNLYKNGFEIGTRLFLIGRDVDNARNDLYRRNSRISIIDMTKIFSVDHLTLAWRLYNNIIEIETLKITQLNNPDSCKFGIWKDTLELPGVSDSPEFVACVEQHEELHKHAVACFVAKESSEIEKSYDELYNTIECSKQFTLCLERLAERMRLEGYSEETEVWKFKK